MNGVRIEQKEGLSFDKPKFVKAACVMLSFGSLGIT